MTSIEHDNPNLVATMDGYLNIDLFRREIFRRLITRLDARRWYESPLSPMIDMFWWHEWPEWKIDRSATCKAIWLNAQTAATFSEMGDMFAEDD